MPGARDRVELPIAQYFLGATFPTCLVSLEVEFHKRYNFSMGEYWVRGDMTF